jgi:bis(5'-nucleosyl)-tetraphosphatase (symmetrical)
VALYAIGDVQGCNAELGELLQTIRFNAERDQLWFVGDLVNRGPDSLGVLRRVRDLRDNAVTVLGNHDLHLLARAFGAAAARKSDTLEAVLDAPDRDVLLQWLANRPLLHEDRAQGLALLHAGLPPQWTMTIAQDCAQEVQGALQRDPARFVSTMYGDQPRAWDDTLRGADRLRFITNCFTRMRYVRADGSMDLKEKDAPAATNPDKLQPWFHSDAARWRGTRIIFGHWSTLGFFRDDNVTCLDTGCAWGNTLTALRIDVPDAAPMSVTCASRTRASAR